MNVRNVVKVMNFHSLLRVDKAKKTADKYRYTEEQLVLMIDAIMNNRNLILDKKLLAPPKDAPELNLYLGSDFGFCSNFNSQIAEEIRRDQGTDQILIGKKLRPYGKDALMCMDNDQFQKDRSSVHQILVDAIEKLSYSRISIIYQKYINTSTIRLERRQIFPVIVPQQQRHTEDFVVEGNLNRLLKNLVISYVNYQVMLAQVSASAAENIMRQNATTESLKRIDEREEELHLEEIRTKREKEFQKVVEEFGQRKNRGDKKAAQ